MFITRTSAIARHVEVAKHLLRQLEEQGATALSALGRDQNTEFFAALEDRTRTLDQLGLVVEAIVQERARATAAQPGQLDAATMNMLSEMAQATEAALESHQRLTRETRRERDRLAEAQARAARPDTVARRYAAITSQPSRPRALSVRG